MKSESERRQEISDFGKRLIALAAAAPDGYAKRDINRTLHHLRRRYKLSSKQKKIEILKKLADGAATFAELLVETGFSRHQLDRDLKQLESEGKIRMEKVFRNGGAGRPQLSYFLTLQ